MKKRISAAIAALLFVVPFAIGPAIAARLPTKVDDIKTGDDLTSVCAALIDRDVSEQGKKSSAICSQFLGDMVLKVSKATAPGAETEFHRLGPDGDKSACFYLPTKLTFVEFAKLVAAYRQSHPETGRRPAFELGAWTLSSNFPCKKE